MICKLFPQNHLQHQMFFGAIGVELGLPDKSVGSKAVSKNIVPD
jgi:hypothetical protein